MALQSSFLQWDHQDPANYLHEVIAMIGPPTDVSPMAGGMAFWNEQTLKQRGSCFVRHELHDELIPHSKPKKHVDYFYSWMDYRIPDEKVWDVLRISGSISYDPLKGWVRARCATLEANIATLWMAIQIAQGKKSISQVQRQGLYGKAITSTQDPAQVQAMMKDLCQAVASQKGRPIYECWKPAFPDDCFY